MLTSFGRIQPRTLNLRRKPVVGVAVTLNKLPQTIKAAVIQFYQTILLAVFNAYACVCNTPKWIAASYSRFYNWWREPHPYTVYGYDLHREIVGFVVLGALSSLFVLYLYHHMLRSYRKHMANIRDMLAYYQRNSEEWEVVAHNDTAIKKFVVSAKELNDLMEFTRNRPKFSKEEKTELQREWESVRKKITKLLERKTGQIYDSDSSDSSTGVEDAESEGRGTRSITALK